MHTPNYIIYLITNKINGKVYIGRTTRGLDVRWNSHKSGINAEKNKRLRLYQAFKEYGIENFSIEQLEKADSFDALKKRESYYIQSKQSYLPEFGYNMSIDTDDGLELLDSASKLKRGKSISSALSKLGNAKYGIGVRFARGYYYACLTHNNINYRLKCVSAEDAAISRDQLAIYFYKNEAVLNRPDLIPYDPLALEKTAQKFIESTKRTFSSKYKGVFRKSDVCFHASIAKDKKSYFLGVYRTEGEAAIAVDKARLFLYGYTCNNLNIESTRVNFTPEQIKSWFEELNRHRTYGMSFDKRIGKYRVCVKINDKFIGLGYYNDSAVAARVHDMAVTYFNLNEPLNYPENIAIYQKESASTITNLLNKKKKFKGVYFDRVKNHYKASLIESGKHHYLGVYNTEEEAAKAYDEGAKRILGSKARLNFT